MLGQIALFFIFEDAWHFFSHQALHYGPLYKHIHKIHHKYSAPFGLAAEYAHPLEVLILGMGTIGGPLLYCYVTQNLHIFTVYAWVTLRLFQAIDAHSGYGTLLSLFFKVGILNSKFFLDFPWSLQHIFPLWSGADHHDFHHMAFTNNFSTSFRYLDFIFGTDDKYRAHKAKLAATRRHGATKEEQAALEKKLFEETEREGVLAEQLAEKSSKW